MMGGAIPRPFPGSDAPGRALDRRPRSRVGPRLLAAVGEVRRARRLADVSFDGRGLGLAHVADQLRVQSHRELRGRGRAHRAVAVLRRRSDAVPAAAIRVPRGRRGVGVQSAQRHPRPLGEAQPRRDRAVRPRRPRPGPNSQLCSRGTPRAGCATGSTGSPTASACCRSRSSATTWSTSSRSRSVAGPDDIVKIFTEQYFFGCEADDPMAALAFDRARNPLGARLPALFASDIGHWDVPDFARSSAKRGSSSRRGTSTSPTSARSPSDNPVALWSGTNPDFFAGTIVEGRGRAAGGSPANPTGRPRA